jgi:hypothetical protein
MIYLIAYVVLVAGIASTTRLVRDDVVLAGWRLNLLEKYGPHWFWNRVLECARCTSVWTAIPWTLAATGYAWLNGTDWKFLVATPLVWWAAAYHAYLLILKGEN